MGIFSPRAEAAPRPATPPDRDDLRRAFAGLDAADADRLARDEVLVRMCHDLPASTPVLAVLRAGIARPTDVGLLHVSAEHVVFTSRGNGITYLPATAVVGVEMAASTVLRVLYRPTAPGLSITFVHDWHARRPGDPEGLDFTVHAQPASLEFFGTQVRRIARG